MGLLATIDRSIRAQAESQPGLMNEFWYSDIGLESDSGIRITPQGAMNMTAFYKCMLWWYQLYGTLPHKLKEKKMSYGRIAEFDAVDHDLYDLIHSSPHPMMTAAEFHGLIPVDQKTRGAFYAFIQRGPNGRPRYLWRLRPEFVKRVFRGGELYFDVLGDDGQWRPFFQDEILYLPSICLDGREAISAVRANHNFMAWHAATTRYSSQFFKNASRPGGVISLESPIKDKKIKEELLENMRRSGKEAGKLLLIEGAATFTKMSLDAEEAQFIFTYNLQEEGICGICDVFPHEVGIIRNANNSIAEQQSINTVTRKLGPMCIQIEQRMNLQLLSDLPSSGIGGGTERSRYVFQSELKGLLRGDTAAQVLFLKTMRDLGIYDGNDCADFVGNPPFEGGDIRVINGAYVPLDMLREIAKNRKPGDVGAPNGPGGSPPTDNQRSELNGRDFMAIAHERIRDSFAPLFADAVGRIASRKKPEDRSKSAAAVFRPVLSGLAAALYVDIDAEFMDRYLAALGGRAAAWNSGDTEDSPPTAGLELERAYDSLLERTKWILN